ncbi:extracellular solute-binding protein [Konateibacter massiliensis]|uniref:extracellular solute-binding protein n=1 Tax=Konateibacter massiliensis TaxID=2002841 RepID=UPI000C1447AE|nr:extracellular solute-binding protein [Konateibacter massiliensis]
MRWKRVIAGVCAGVMLTVTLTGCGSKSADTSSTGSQTENTTAQAENPGEASNVTDIELWGTNTGYLPVEKDSELYNFYKDLIGVGIIQPYVEWNGGATYQEQLNLRIAAGEMPDVFAPVDGMEANLIESGALLDLTELLPEYAPNLWNLIPEEVWNVMRANDPTGQGRIYTIPNVISYGRDGGMIRQDWLDALGLQMPTTQEEYVNVLRAFKNDDPNGNGVQDEIPTGGRAEARWMDHLFAMYGIAIREGYPQWDTYDGELTYSAVTPNMRDALEWISSLYAEGLIDPESLLNDKAAWDGKINSNLVGNWFHIPQETYMYAETIESTTGAKPDITILPALSAPGYEGYYTSMKITGIGYVVANTDDEEKIMAIMKMLNAYADTSLWNDYYNGVEGMHSTKVGDNLVRLPDDKKTQQNLVLTPYNSIATVDFQSQLLKGQMTQEREWSISQSIRNLQDNQQYVRPIAGDGIPASIYNNYPDIQNRALYIEYATKIIIGEYPIEKFDEFVEKWYASGGEEVTKAARDWYGSLK